MKRFALAFGVCLAAVSIGCDTFRWNFLNRDRQQQDDKSPLPGVPSVASLIMYLNDNSSRVQGFRCTDIDVRVDQGSIIAPHLRAKMMAQQPRNFLMSASALGSDVVDIGSNDQEFWFWSSKINPPYQFYASYKDFKEGRVRNLPFPFQPEWVMETMGMANFGPPERWTIDNDNQKIRLTEKITSPQGQPMRKVIVMHRRVQSAPNPQVVEHLLLDDATGKEVASARILQVEIDPMKGGIVPTRMELRYPKDNVKLTLSMSRPEANPNVSSVAFQRQRMQGVTSFDLARMQPDNTVQRVQGTAP
ncbi:MAG: hypothetical protein K2X38_07985 [Gemmataceae bacterium]|nr:hypothetical protein [Gemmataceae bacterium]